MHIEIAFHGKGIFNIKYLVDVHKLKIPLSKSFDKFNEYLYE